MKRLLSFLSILVSVTAFCQSRPNLVTIEGQPRHVQGMAYDQAKERFYFSFTTCFLVTDSAGNILGSIEKIHGHLGAMTFDPVGRKVYASLECKDDSIGSSISKDLGEQIFQTSSFYIAEIDVDKVDALNVSENVAIRRIDVVPANEDYASKKYACSGIDGVAIAPAFGKPDGNRRYLYVAYGIYGDVNRTDNDYQVLLRYPLGDWKSKPEKYFVKTGNTNWGVQNLAFDKSTGLLIMAVYKGKKAEYPNYSVFAIDINSKPLKAGLDGVPYQKTKVKTLPLASEGWYFDYGTMGLCALGDGYFYIAEGTKVKNNKATTHGCNARLYKWIGGQDAPFVSENR